MDRGVVFLLFQNMNKNLQIALIGITIAGITFGLVTPVTVVLLEKNHSTSFIIGLVTTINYLPFVLLSAFTGRLINRRGIKFVLLAGLIIITIGIFGHIFWKSLLVLIPVRFITGVGSTFIFIATEILINNSSNEKTRGKNIGLYVVLLSTGIALGTMLIWTVEIADWIPFVIGASGMLIVLVMQFWGIEQNKDLFFEPPKEKFSLSKMPSIAIMSSFIYGIFESSIFVALPLYALRKNFSTEEVSYFLSALVTGGIILLYYISSLSDKYSKYKILLWISVLLAALFITPILSANVVYLILVFFLIGGLVPGYYTIGLNYTMEIVKKEYMSESNGYYIMFYGIGTLLGPIIGAFLVDLNVNFGFWLFSALVCFLFFFVYMIKRLLKNNA
jgi:MFS family permease